jgi:hypothetical protein
MTFNAVLKVPNAFFDVLPANLVRGVLVATVASVLAIVVSNVASHTLNVVVTVKSEELIVVERRGSPFFLAMALTAIAGDLLMQRVSRRPMAGLALLTSIGL